MWSNDVSSWLQPVVLRGLLARVEARWLSELCAVSRPVSCRVSRFAVLLASVLSVAAGCRCSEDDAGPRIEASAGSSTSAAPGTTAPAPVSPVLPPATLTGASIARSPDAKTLYVADEVNSQLHVVSLPLTADSLVGSVKLPGPPAQVVVAAERVWVSIRAPGLIWVGRLSKSPAAVAPVPDAGAPLVVEEARIVVPSDAWGLALSPGLRRAIVTSAWSSRVSYVDLESERALWSVDVAREPRGVVIAADGKFALVTHLVGAQLTHLTLDDTPTEPARILLPPAPLRSPGGALPAALGYAGVLSPDGSRYYAARHALGALGKNAWFGAATVDVLRVAARSPLAPERPRQGLEQKSQLAEQLISGSDTRFPGSSSSPVAQPRALLYRQTTDTLLVAGEGDDRIVELDALAVDPTMAVMGHYLVGEDYHPIYHVAADCAAPSGMVLSPDENTLWAHCVGTNDLAEVALRPSARSEEADPTGVSARLKLADDPLGPGGATGRKLFYASSDFPTSGGLGCAGCHPEGRDDGHVWHEASFTTEDGDTTNFVGHAANIPKEAHAKGYARRTPMLAGRLYAKGPYGWHAESPTIVERELQGFGLHRWGAVPQTPRAELETRARALFDFLRRGLVPPPRTDEPLTAEQRRGQALFLSKQVGCAECHDPKTGYTTQKAYPLPLLPLADGFDEDPNSRYKIPGLAFLAGRAPYFHDGSAASITEIIEQNGTRMGNTANLSPEDRAALVAFLRTL